MGSGVLYSRGKKSCQKVKRAIPDLYKKHFRKLYKVIKNMFETMRECEDYKMRLMFFYVIGDRHINDNAIIFFRVIGDRHFNVDMFFI